MSCLYLGLDPRRQKLGKKLVHFPLIAIKSKTLTQAQKAQVIKQLKFSKRILFTSRSAVDLFFSYVKKEDICTEKQLMKKLFIAIGEGTNERLKHFGIKKAFIPKDATQEGVIDWLEDSISARDKGHIFWPRSTKARDKLQRYCTKRGLSLFSWELYNTCLLRVRSKPDLEKFQKIIFTSPTTVEAFCLNYGLNKLLSVVWEAIGPVTQTYVEKRIEAARKS
jgi:uroporphyrinogen-III synthase